MLLLCLRKMLCRLSGLIHAQARSSALQCKTLDSCSRVLAPQRPCFETHLITPRTKVLHRCPRQLWLALHDDDLGLLCIPLLLSLAEIHAYGTSCIAHAVQVLDAFVFVVAEYWLAGRQERLRPANRHPLKPLTPMLHSAGRLSKGRRNLAAAGKIASGL